MCELPGYCLIEGIEGVRVYEGGTLGDASNIAFLQTLLIELKKEPPTPKFTYYEERDLTDDATS